MKIEKIWIWLGKNHYELLVILTFCALITTMVIAAISIKTQVNLANQQNELSEANINLIKQTSSTNWAHLEIRFGRPYEEKILVTANDLANPEKEVTSRFSINTTIINSGKVESGGVYNIGYGKDKNIFTTFENNAPINIPAQSGITKIIYLNQKLCKFGSEKNCNASEIPSREYNLSLYIACEFCESNQRIINLTIPLCISHNYTEANYCYKKYYFQPF